MGSLYAKMVDGALEFFKNPVKLPKESDLPTGEFNSVDILFTNDRNIIESLGYKEVIRTEPPEIDEGYWLYEYWIEEENQIVQSWNIHEVPSRRKNTSKELYEIIDTLTGEI